MKTNHCHWAAPLTGALLLGAGVSASAEQDNYTYLDSTNRLTLSFRLGFNIHAKFTGIGTTAGNGYYYDGYVLTDSTDNFLGLTSYWGYQNATQYSQLGDNNQPPNSFVFHKPSSAGLPPSISDSDNPHPGAELTYDRQLGVKEDWHNLRYGVEAALNYMPISMENNNPYNVGVTTDTYIFGGVPGQIPVPGHQGLFSGNPGDPVLVVPGTGVTTPGGTLLTQNHFDADLWGGRLGPYVELPLSEKLNLRLSGGLALGLLDGSGSWQEKLSLNGNTLGTLSGSGDNFDVLWGYYASLDATWQINRRWAIDGAVQFQDLGTYSHDFGGRGVQVDLSRSLFLELGVSYSF
jgi:hypothetical protein